MSSESPRSGSLFFAYLPRARRHIDDLWNTPGVLPDSCDRNYARLVWRADVAVPTGVAEATSDSKTAMSTKWHLDYLGFLSVRFPVSITLEYGLRVVHNEYLRIALAMRGVWSALHQELLATVPSAEGMRYPVVDPGLSALSVGGDMPEVVQRLQLNMADCAFTTYHTLMAGLPDAATTRHGARAVEAETVIFNDEQSNVPVLVAGRIDDAVLAVGRMLALNDWADKTYPVYRDLMRGIASTHEPDVFDIQAHENHEQILLLQRRIGQVANVWQELEPALDCQQELYPNLCAATRIIRHNFSYVRSQFEIGTMRFRERFSTRERLTSLKLSRGMMALSALLIADIVINLHGVYFGGNSTVWPRVFVALFVIVTFVVMIWMLRRKAG